MAKRNGIFDVKAEREQKNCHDRGYFVIQFVFCFACQYLILLIKQPILNGSTRLNLNLRVFFAQILISIFSLLRLYSFVSFSCLCYISIKKFFVLKHKSFCV